MSRLMADRFIKALGRLEKDGEVNDLVELYSPDALVGNMLAFDELRGQTGARSFWTTYRQNFGTVRSTFHNVIADEDGAALEWTSEGTSPSGRPFHYRGVTVLQFAFERITRSCAYFDSGTLGSQLVTTMSGTISER